MDIIGTEMNLNKISKKLSKDFENKYNETERTFDKYCVYRDEIILDTTHSIKLSKINRDFLIFLLHNQLKKNGIVKKNKCKSQNR